MSEKPKVYFTKIITPEKLVEMFKILKKDLPGNVGVKVHSGERGNKNFIKPEFLKPLVDLVNGTIIETNTSCPDLPCFWRTGEERHKIVLEEHGWTKTFNKVDILDSEGPDDVLKIPND